VLFRCGRLSSISMEAKGKRMGKARVADHLRRRALVSCDRCKKRRIRCLRAPGSDSHDACQSCLEAGIDCESTLPRKTRIYGSVETLSLRFRVLDALVKGLYPQQDTSDISTLYSIAKTHNIVLPAFDEQALAEEVLRHPSHSGSPPDAPVTISIANDANEIRTLPDSPREPVVEEKLVPLPRGPSHYIGPSSSFGFVLAVRNMVAEFNAATKATQPDDERAKLSADFAGSNWSKALEPIHKDESEESCEEQAGQTVINRADAERVLNKVTPRPSLLHSTSADATASEQFRKATLLSLFPAKEVSDTLIKTYFDKVHPNYLLFHQETFEIRYNDMWLHPGVLLRNVEPGWACCLCMMMAFGAQALEDHDRVKAGQIQRHYLEFVQGKMHQLISATTLINVQALLLLQLYQHNCTERNSAFMLLGCASRMAMALGMHRGGTSGGFDDLEREVRKRVWWTLYTFEQNQCAILGRPCVIDDTEVNVSYPNELVLDGNFCVPIGYVEHLVRLTKLMSEVRRKIYAATSSTHQLESAKTDAAIQFLMDLDTWHNSLPAHLQLEYPSHPPNHHRAVILLHVQFRHTQALVTRPFLLRKVSVQLARRLGKHVRSRDLDREDLDLSQSCGTFSRNGAALLHELLTTGLFDGVAWIDAYYVYHAVFILALDFLARPYDDVETSEDAARKKAVRDLTNAIQNVKLCPTFKVLTQVSLQLSKIVGILDTTPGLSKAQSTRPEIVQPHMTGYDLSSNAYTIDSQNTQPGVEVAVNSWFQKEPIGVSWDMREFFGADGYVCPVESDYSDLPMAMSNGYGLNMPGFTEQQVFVPPLPANLGFTPWGTVEPPLAPVRGGPVSSTYKGGI